jgi:hypothetical protein
VGHAAMAVAMISMLAAMMIPAAAVLCIVFQVSVCAAAAWRLTATPTAAAESGRCVVDIAAMIAVMLATPVAHRAGPVTAGPHSAHHLSTGSSVVPSAFLAVLLFWSLARVWIRLSTNGSRVESYRFETSGILLMMGSMGAMAATA